MTEVLSLLAALAFALGNVLQQKGTLETAAPGDDPHFLTQLFRRPIWLAGGACQVSGWVLQAMALKNGSLVVVLSLTTLSLVIALPLGAKITHQRITRRVTWGAIAIVVGIVTFLAVGSPESGDSLPTAADWWIAGLVASVIVVVLYRMGRAQEGAKRALMFGSAAGVAFGMQAAVTKDFTGLLGQGLSTLLTSWTIYVLILSALAGFVLQQSALKTNILAPAMASSNAVTLFANVVLGVTVFGETISGGDARRAPAIGGLVLALIGIVMLAGAKPPKTVTGEYETSDRPLVPPSNA